MFFFPAALRGSHPVRPVATLRRAAVLFSTGLSVAALSLAGCGFIGDEQSTIGGDAPPSTPTEKVMSGEYEVGPDGKLLNPKRNDLPKVPQKPIEMNQNNAKGAEAFARHYMKMIEYAWLTGNTSYLRDSSDPKCEGCKRFIEATETLQSQGGWSYGGESTFEDVSPAFEVPEHLGLWHKELLQTQEPNVYYDGSNVFHGEKREVVIRIQMRFDQGKGWRAAALEAEGK